nr:MAG TPA: helix-turn-helix domain protein [Caudoviricetes sp.]
MERELFVQNIKEYCRARGVRPTAACRESGVGVSFINDIERGQTPSVAKVQMLAQYLGCTVSDLLGEERDAKAAAPEDSGLSEEFARIFGNLTPENQNKIIAEMLKRQREQ